MKKYLKFLIYISILFLVIYLYKLDYIAIENLTFNYKYILLAILFLFLGFFGSIISWYYSMSKHNIMVSIKSASISQGLSVFAKYIPGKLWTILGRAGIINTYYNFPLRNLTLVSLKEQFISIWTSLVLSIWPIVTLVENQYIVCYIIFLILLSSFLFIKKIHDLVIQLIHKIVKKEIDIPFIKAKDFSPVFIACFGYWIMWMIGFYFLNHAIIINPSLKSMFLFPFGAVIGLLALIVPGGIGVREGLIVLGLTKYGTSLPVATSIALLSRLWFLIGEFLIFIVALVLKKGIKNEKY
ncbi:MAG: flippase-like domain-containing protein [Bacteroidales bacterium]|nr:flippase-like domain-containing protein [Bacteroidales bacterium]